MTWDKRGTSWIAGRAPNLPIEEYVLNFPQIANFAAMLSSFSMGLTLSPYSCENVEDQQNTFTSKHHFNHCWSAPVIENNHSKRIYDSDRLSSHIISRVLIRQCTSLGDRADIFNHWSTSTVVKMVFGRKRIMLILDIFTQIRWKSEDNLKRIYDSDRLSSLIISRPKPQILLRFRWGFQEMQNHLTLVSVGTAEK